jgi:hypothetical protein
MRVDLYGKLSAWTLALQSRRMAGRDCPAWGIALLYYGPDKRLGLSVWGKFWSRYYMLCGARP